MEGAGEREGDGEEGKRRRACFVPWDEEEREREWK